MLLGAIGYKSNIEGFVDTGWTMNVARIGNVAGRVVGQSGGSVGADHQGDDDLGGRAAGQLRLGTEAAVLVTGDDTDTVQNGNCFLVLDLVLVGGPTFAGVIGYCKTAGYISGYGDGTFKPANPLTGFAFAKMLLGRTRRKRGHNDRAPGADP